MNKALKEYMLKNEAVEFDPTLLQEHIQVMTEHVIPAIVEDQRKAEQLAAELRYSPATAQRRDLER